MCRFQVFHVHESCRHSSFRCYAEHVKIFALTGGIAAGKSTVAQRFSERGAHVISADELVRQVQSPNSPVLDAISQRFGFGVITESGELDRAALGRLVFDDEIARSDLEAIVHPAISHLFARQIREIQTADPDATVIYDIPLLAETGRAGEFDGVILADAPVEVRRERLMSLRGLSLNEADSRIDSQASDDERRVLATWIIDTSGTLDQTLSRTDEVWAELVASSSVEEA